MGKVQICSSGNVRARTILWYLHMARAHIPKPGANVGSYMALSASSEVISGSDRSDSWPIKRCGGCCCCVMCTGLHTEVEMGGQTRLSVVKGEMPAKLGCVSVLLHWLWEPIREEAEGELLILGLFHNTTTSSSSTSLLPPPSSWSVFLCAAAGLGADLH